jgi:hypothetical protein
MTIFGVRTLAAGDWEMDFVVQVQKDPHLMPLEDATVKWPERLVPVHHGCAAPIVSATLRLRGTARVRRCAALQPVA